MSVYDLSLATKHSYEEHSIKPIVAETVRQVADGDLPI